MISTEDARLLEYTETLGAKPTRSQGCRENVTSDAAPRSFMSKTTIAAPRTYNSQETQRMQELNGTPLATFTARALAFAADFLLAAALFLGVMFAIAKMVNIIPAVQQDKRHLEIELNFFHNWYSVVYLVIFFGLSLYWGKGQTLGKRLMRIRVVSIVHHDLSL